MLVSADGCGIYFNVVPLKGSNAGRPGGSSCGMGMGKWLRGREEEELAPSVVPGGSSCGMGKGKGLRGIEEEELAPSVEVK